MGENHVRVLVAHFEGEYANVVEVGKVITGEAVTKGIMRPFLEAGCSAGGLQSLA